VETYIFLSYDNKKKIIIIIIIKINNIIKFIKNDAYHS